MDSKKPHRHFKIFKPDGFLSQFITDQSKAKKKNMLGQLYDFPEGTMAAGRLDEGSEGLLILTTDGKVSAEITASGMEKSYCAQVDGIITQEAIDKLKNGLEISINGRKHQTKPCQAELKGIDPNFPAPNKKIRASRHGPTSWVTIVLTEGKFRQVRKMTAVVGFPTLRLVRDRIGTLNLNKMQPGDVEEISWPQKKD
jgi:23S rRNA pseudouridine2457 synthase